MCPEHSLGGSERKTSFGICVQNLQLNRGLTMDSKTETLIQVFSDEKLDMISETLSRCLKCYCYYFCTLESVPADVDRRVHFVYSPMNFFVLTLTAM